MKEKSDIVTNWLPRYTGVPLDGFGRHILLTNFGGYLDVFARLIGTEVVGRDRPMPSATHDGISMINFGMGSANAATVMDLLTAIMPESVLFLGKCGCLKFRQAGRQPANPSRAVVSRHLSKDLPWS